MIPTAEGFIDKEYYHIKLDLNKTDSYINISDIYQAIIEFAKLHVEAALKSASENAQRKKVYNGNSQRLIVKRVIDKESILNAYPLTLIK